uniref:Ig-like domain-containing protein n=2 Tax=Gasterosteus aculeatus aculeatus TaxID=481459 RepID=G3NA78_GASAC|nr:myelin-associated glycoprotein-like isoform X1 [Gasterosteus aculeatus aculeatus]
MDSVKWPMLFVCLCFRVTQTEASSWKVKVPSSVKGLPGSCVFIPCSFNYPDTDIRITEFLGMWFIAGGSSIIYHPDESKMIKEFQGRTELLGDVRQKNCSLKIDPLKSSDSGPFFFRIEMKGYDNGSYTEQTSITMMSELNDISFTVKEEGQTVVASYSVPNPCPTSPPVFTWSLPGKQHFQLRQLDDGQWTATSTLHFNTTRADHNMLLRCNVTYKGGQIYKAERFLRLKHAPVNVNVEHKSDVTEGEAVPLSCSCDAHPPASYQWHDETGAKLHDGNVYKLPNVSRHTGALFCTAINDIGQRKSNPVLLNVLYMPEIKTVSSCSSEAHMVKCVCIAESRPVSMIHFVLPDRVLPRVKVEQHGTVTIGTLHAEFGSSCVVLCVANNTLGNANITLSLPVNSTMQNLYIVIASGAAGILVTVLIAVSVFKKCKGKSANAQTRHIVPEKTDKDVALPHCSATKRKEKRYEDVHSADIFDNDHVYGNMETDCGDAIYANM